jgi:hypothetical protein
LTTALNTLMGIVGDSKELRRVSLRLFSKFAGETLTEREMEEIVETGVKVEPGATPGPGQGRPVDQPSARKPMERPRQPVPKRPNPSRKQGRPEGTDRGPGWVKLSELHGRGEVEDV